jgi:hypothetical protein
MLDKSLQRIFGLGGSYVASTKYSPSGGALKPKAGPVPRLKRRLQVALAPLAPARPAPGSPTIERT